MHTANSEISLVNYDLISDTHTLNVEGIGPIAQYDSYADKLYSHGVIYFLRDSLLQQITAQLERGVAPATLRADIRRLNDLNSEIKAWERDASGEDDVGR